MYDRGTVVPGKNKNRRVKGAGTLYDRGTVVPGKKKKKIDGLRVSRPCTTEHRDARRSTVVPLQKEKRKKGLECTRQLASRRRAGIVSRRGDGRGGRPLGRRHWDGTTGTLP